MPGLGGSWRPSYERGGHGLPRAPGAAAAGLSAPWDAPTGVRGAGTHGGCGTSGWVRVQRALIQPRVRAQGGSAYTEIAHTPVGESAWGHARAKFGAAAAHGHGPRRGTPPEGCSATGAARWERPEGGIPVPPQLRDRSGTSAGPGTPPATLPRPRFPLPRAISGGGGAWKQQRLNGAPPALRLLPTHKVKTQPQPQPVPGSGQPFSDPRVSPRPAGLNRAQPGRVAPYRGLGKGGGLRSSPSCTRPGSGKGATGAGSGGGRGWGHGGVGASFGGAGGGRNGARRCRWREPSAMAVWVLH